METIFMDTENSKTNEPHRFRLTLPDKLNLKGCVHYIFTSFCISKREHFQKKEKCFLFCFESSSPSWDNEILTF